jgi:two-component system response regulator HydG
MLKKLLERHQYQVTIVNSPREVKRIVQKQFYEVVLTDLRMPNASGMDLIKLIKSESPETQVVMMTGYADISTAIQSIKYGAFNYIPKPFLPEEVLNIIQEALADTEKKLQVRNPKNEKKTR